MLENLKLQLSLHHELLSLLEKKRRAVIERDVGALEAALMQEEDVVETLRRLTDVRTSIMEKFAERMGMPSKEITLRSIGEKIEDEIREAFTEILQELSETAHKIVDLDTVTMPKKKPEVVASPLPAAGN